MLPNSNKNSKKSESILDKNLKLMGVSAIVLVALFIYTLFKSSSNIASPQYFIGMVFLFILLFMAISLRFYKDKIRKFIPKNKFMQEMEKAAQKSESTVSSANSYEHHIDHVTSDITFKDVAGIQSVKAELEEIVDFLNAPKKYLKHGVKLPKGVLLVGPPGVGKTLIARAVAGEAKVPFFYQSGASFVHIYVGMGAKRVKELFAKAKANAPAIVFIDEIDAVGKSRSGTSNDEREATLNELLTQMDGFDGESGVIVIAATNKIEVLDEALLRAGRFDRRVFLNLPNIHDREKILELYLKNKSYEFDLKQLAFSTAGFTSSALATLINEALLNMIKREGSTLLIDDIEMAKTKIEFGKKEQKILNEQQKEILAIYQASKAYISQSEITLFEEGIKKDEDVYPSKTKLINELKAYLSGSIGVEVLKGELYAINPQDLHSAQKLALTMVNEFKMADDAETLILNVRSDLKSEIYKHSSEVERLKTIMLMNETIGLDDLNA